MMRLLGHEAFDEGASVDVGVCTYHCSGRDVGGGQIEGLCVKSVERNWTSLSGT